MILLLLCLYFYWKIEFISGWVYCLATGIGYGNGIGNWELNWEMGNGNRDTRSSIIIVIEIETTASTRRWLLRVQWASMWPQEWAQFTLSKKWSYICFWRIQESACLKEEYQDVEVLDQYTGCPKQDFFFLSARLKKKYILGYPVSFYSDQVPQAGKLSGVWLSARRARE